MRSDLYIFVINCIADMFETYRCYAAEISEGISSDADGIYTDRYMRNDFKKRIDGRLDDMIVNTDSLRERMICMKSLVWIRRRVDELHYWNKKSNRIDAWLRLPQHGRWT